MSSTTFCVPVSDRGTVEDLPIGRVNRVATCRVDNGEVVDWVEHVVDWDTSYGVDVAGPHHTRVVRFMRDHEVGTVVAGEVCESVTKVLTHMGVDVRTRANGDAREAVLAI
ncbi:MAG: NifB/NifX family molybdenum-iron cluster-binding protein [Candidatus Nanopelagicales bacterium]